MSVIVKIENYYSDGHESESEVVIEEDPTLVGEDDLDEWFEEVVFQYTGDGYGEKYPKLGCGYVATILSADEASIVGETFEWF